MTLSRKLLTTIIAALLITFSFGATAYASELDGTTATQSTTEATNDTIVTDNSTEDQTTDTLTQNVLAIDPTDENLDLLLQEGYFIDEQGELRYEAPIPEETVAEETEEAEVVEEEEKEDPEEKPSYSESDLRLLSCLIFSEAGNQNYNGMLAVANVVLNRAKSDAYWHVNTVKEVIYDDKWSVQFAVTIKNKSGVSMLDKALKLYDTRKFTGANPETQKKALDKAIKAAKAALSGKNNIGNLLCFQNKRSASSIKKKYSDYQIIDDHIFYRSK
jgi:spore germination cell wall hydrolase CwlJ-like protein